MTEIMVSTRLRHQSSADGGSSLKVPPRPEGWLGVRSPLLRSLWAWPLVLSMVFVLGVMRWLYVEQQEVQEALRQNLIADALSLESQLSARLEAEVVSLQNVGNVLVAEASTPAEFQQHPLVLEGLRRFWISVTWLDERGQIKAHAPDDGRSLRTRSGTLEDDGAMSGHLSVAVMPSGEVAAGARYGQLVARYSPASILRQRLPWWLASKYDIRLVDLDDEVIVSTTTGPRLPHQMWYRVSMSPSLPNAWLELAARQQLQPWWQTMPMALMAGFLVLVALATVMLRQQVRSVVRAETAWRTEVAWRSAMEDSLAVGIRARDLDGRLVYVNKTMADMVGYRPEELQGLLPPMPYWAPDDMDRSMKRHEGRVAGQVPIEAYESRWLHRDGSAVDVMVFEAPLVDASGKHIGWMASILNITERKRMEERERKQMETMAHHARLTMIGEVASTLAHELNQPLTVIASYNAGVLNALQASGMTDPGLLQALQRMGEQAAHAGRIVRRIREFLTRHEPQLEPCAIADVVRSAVGLLRRDIARHHVQVDWLLDEHIPLVKADAVLIEQVVVNLVRNACDAIGALGRPGCIRISAEVASQGRFVKVTVSDDGPGVGANNVEVLCAPFYTTKAEGMGMGLVICRSIIELHCGVLDVEGSVLGGAAFSFSLPVNMPPNDV